MSSKAERLPPLARIAKRRMPGIASRNSSNRLPAASVCCSERPVALPPGRAKEATSPVPTGSPTAANTISHGGRGRRRDDNIHLSPDELDRDFFGELSASLRPLIFDIDGLTLDPAQFAQALHEGRNR